MAKEKILISACLLGARVRYDGRDALSRAILNLQARYELIPLCPEVAGGLPTPRAPAEIVSGHVLTQHGEDISAAFQRGAALAVALAKRHGIKRAILKSKSPSCGLGQIYDGRFSGQLIAGNGITAQALLDNGVQVFTENEISALENAQSENPQNF